MTIQSLGPSTNGNFVVSYDDTQTVAQGMAQTILNTCEADFSSLSDWFGVTGFGPSDHINVVVQPISAGGADNFGYQSGGNSHIDIGIVPGWTQANLNATAPMLLVAELSEIFMAKKWNGSIFAANHSDGEGLSQFCALSLHHAGYYTYYGFAFADNWLQLNPRPDWVSNVDPTDGNGVSYGCSLMFLYYLRDQLGFTIKEIIRAGGPSLSATYQNLTGDPSPPFDFFSYLVNSVFPVGQAISVNGEAENDPFPLFLFQFGGNKTSFSKVEVQNSITTNIAFTDCLRLQLQGCSPSTWNSFSGPAPAQPSFAPGQVFPGIHFNARAQPIFQNASLQRAPQLIEFVYDVTCDSSAIPAFTTAPQIDELDSSITIAGKPALTAQIPLTFYGTQDPYLLTYAPNADNQPWLSYDLRVFSAVGGSQPVPGFPTTLQNSNPGAYSYIKALLPYLSTNFGDAGGIDPFDPNNNIIPGQTDALTGDSSVIPSTGFLGLGGIPVRIVDVNHSCFVLYLYCVINSARTLDAPS
jgi:hypothetical protein